MMSKRIEKVHWNRNTELEYGLLWKHDDEVTHEEWYATEQERDRAYRKSSISLRDITLEVDDELYTLHSHFDGSTICDLIEFDDLVLRERDDSYKGVCDTKDKRLGLGRKILRAIAEHDDDFYDWVTSDAYYPCNDEDKYHDGTADYDDDVDIAEMNAIIELLSWVVTNHHPHKVVFGGNGEEE
jgi:hypothetical protein